MMKDMDEEDDLLFDQQGLLDLRKRKSTVSVWCQNFTKTVCLSLTFFTLGLCIAVPGPTLLDLGERVNTDIAHISLIFTARSVGYMLGSLLGGCLFDHFDKQLLLFTSLMVAAVATIVIPWCLTLTVLMIMITLQGVTMGMLDTGGNAFCVRIWSKKSPPYMQAMHFAFGIGAFIAPLISQPFLSNQPILGVSNQSILSLGMHGNIPIVNNGDLLSEFKTNGSRNIRSIDDDADSSTFLPTNFSVVLSSTTEAGLKSKTVSAVSMGTIITTGPPTTITPKSKKPKITDGQYLTDNKDHRNGKKIKPFLDEQSQNNGNEKNVEAPPQPKQSDVQPKTEDSQVTNVASNANMTIVNISSEKREDDGHQSTDLSVDKNTNVSSTTTAQTHLDSSTESIPSEETLTSPPVISKEGTSRPSTTTTMTQTEKPSSTAKVTTTSQATPEPTTTTVTTTQQMTPVPTTTTQSKTTTQSTTTTVKTTVHKTTATEKPTTGTPVVQDHSSKTNKPNTDQSVSGTTGTGTSSLPKLTTSSGLTDDDNTTLDTTGVPHKPNQTLGDMFNSAMNAVKNMSTIQFAYLIIGGMLMINAMFFFILYCCNKNKSDYSALETNKDNAHSMESFQCRVLILILMFFFIMAYVGIETTFGGLIMTFTVYHQNWKKDQGAVLTAIFWGSLAAGRGLSIFITGCCKPYIMLTIDLVLVIIGALVLSFGVSHFDFVLWLGTLCLGFGMSSVFPTAVTWIEQYYRVTGKTTAVLVMGSALGQMIIPVTTGYFYQNFNKMALMYSVLCLSLFMALLYVVMQTVASRVGKSSPTSQNGFMRLKDEDTLELDDVSYGTSTQESTRRRFMPTFNDVEYDELKQDEEEDLLL